MSANSYSVQHNPSNANCYVTVLQNAAIMHYTIHYVLYEVLHEVLYAPEICFLLTDAHFVAGPHALHRGFQSFMADQGVIVQNVSTDSARAQH